ncbi:hypothetical protein SASPL_146920 [Salvia splendens]|uniref:Uncharacterized protein n=1 Tax=Salvia splendens TaxID=180675 RepID=A0A8X8Z5N4_SALSN|nr:hypothetical protein SASPL_146920 [Salvia splendens]
MKEAQLKFKISRQSCTRMWNAAKKQQAAGQAIQLVNNKKTSLEMAQSRRHAQLPTNLEVPVELVIEAIEYLKTMGCNEGLHIISQALGIQQIGGAGVIAGAEVFERAEVIEGAEVIAEAKVIEGAEDVEGAENIAGAEHIAGSEVIAGAEHIKGAKVIEGAEDVEGTEEV